MTSKAALFALLALWGVGVGGALPVRADDAGDTPSSEAKSETGLAIDGFVNRVWQQSGTDGQPGLTRIFLSDGTLVMDSCWETHRLSSWTLRPDGRLSWSEGDRRIDARVERVSRDSLTLVIERKGGSVEEHYVAAPVPSICPDLSKA